MTDPWTEQLSAYLDGELDAAQRQALEHHLAGCASCQAALRQLKGVVAWAQGYSGSPPKVDVWPRVAAGMTPRGAGADMVDLPARHKAHWPTAFRSPQALAAGIALAVVAASSWWLARATAPVPEMQGVVAAWEPPAGAATRVSILAAERYGAAIAELERAVIDGEGRLDSVTVRVVRAKLEIIDRAIAEARTALATDPNSIYLAEHFTRMMRRKLTLLRNAARAATVQT